MAVDEATRTRFQKLAETADELMHRVDEALVTDAPHPFMVETRAKVDALGAELRDMLGGLGEKARAGMERTVGRKVTDLQRRASRLPALSGGNPVKKKPNTDFVENRPPPPSRPPSPKASTAPRRTAARPRRTTGLAPVSNKPLSPLIQASLANAAVVKPYSMEGSYQLGDVIDHATFGRGRVERLQPRAMQVQFAIGMKSLRTG
jgi:hypothetical protein